MDSDVPPPPVRLEAWLAAHREGTALLLGGTGHLDLSDEEEARVALQLERLTLPATPSQDVMLMTGLAPGADVLLVELLPALLARRGLRCRIIGLLPVPAEHLWQDWLARTPGRSAATVAAMRTRFDAALERCEVRIELWDDPPPHWAAPGVHETQYRRLGAFLARSTDVLLAVLKPGREPQPGSTAEVVAWRRNPADIPPGLETAGARAGGSALTVIDPSPQPLQPADAAAVARRARAELDAGDYLACFDIVTRAAEQGCVSDELEYVRLLALANAGSTEAALLRLSSLPKGLRTRSEDWLALEGRLHKDLGGRGGPQAREHFRRAAEAYLAAYARTTGSFSGINAATTTLLAGDADTARRFATHVLSELDGPDAGTEMQRYHRHATEAEGALILGDAARVRRALAAAHALLPGNVNVRSRTLQQLRRVAAAAGMDPAALAPLALPPAIYMPPGSDPAAISPLPDFALAHAPLTEPGELAALEGVLDRGWRVHAVLAAPRAQLAAHWRATYGPRLSARLGAALDRVHDVSVARGFLPGEERWCDAYVASMALGLSRLTANRLGCGWRALGGSVPRDTPEPPPVAEGPVRFGRRFAGVIFADFAGFSRVADAELPAFWARFMRAIGDRLPPLAADLLFRHTWGDALHLVTSSAAGAARVACAIQSCLHELRDSLPGSLAQLELRLSAHYAPVFQGPDPVEGIDTYFGTQLSLAARIEPVTPPGMIFVTEAFAAALALEAPEAYVLEYAGEVALAKNYGRSRLFSLRPVE